MYFIKELIEGAAIIYLFLKLYESNKRLAQLAKIVQSMNNSISKNMQKADRVNQKLLAQFKQIQDVVNRRTPKK